MSVFTRTVGFLVPVENIAEANDAAVQMSNNEPDRGTFVAEQYLIKTSDGSHWCFAHGSLTDACWDMLPGFQAEFDFEYFQTGSGFGNFWTIIEGMGYERVPEEEPPPIED